MKVEIKDGQLIITIPVMDPPQPSASQKNLVLATTRGNVRSEATYQGKQVVIGLNAYIPR